MQFHGLLYAYVNGRINLLKHLGSGRLKHYIVKLCDCLAETKAENCSCCVEGRVKQAVQYGTSTGVCCQSNVRAGAFFVEERCDFATSGDTWTENKCKLYFHFNCV